jgi:thiol-disulfide isomerase/thioredoxin
MDVTMGAHVIKKIVMMIGLMATSVMASPDKLAAPQKPLTALDGGSQFSGEFSGRAVTVVQYWASWCTGCAVVMGEISEILQSRKDIGYVTISLDETREVAMKFFGNKSELVQSAIKRSYLDPSGAMFAERAGVDSLPYLMFVGKDGTIIKRIKGHPTKADLALLRTQG